MGRSPRRPLICRPSRSEAEARSPRQPLPRSVSVRTTGQPLIKCDKISTTGWRAEMKSILALLCVASAFGANKDSPTGNRTTPPTITSVAPQGVARGATVEITVEGLNLAKASAIYFSQPGITARILRVKELPDLPDIRLG